MREFLGKLLKYFCQLD